MSPVQQQATADRILVVDDEELNRDMLSRRLSRRGYEVVSAESAAEADLRLQESECDLILLDIMMPGVDGFAYLASLRERWNRAELPVIMATAKDTSEDIVRALKLGANDYVTKPLDFQVVLARVETQIQLKNATSQLAEANRLLEDDLQRAARFQQSQLPKPDLTVRGCRFAWTYQPCDALAGDFLGVIPLDETRTAFYVLDVSGHGTAAALLSAAVGRALSVTHGESSVVARWARKGLMRGNRLEVISPSEVTSRLNRHFEYDISEGKYFTSAYTIIDTEAGELAYTQAGHPPQVYVPLNDSCRLLPGKGVPVGLLGGEDVDAGSFQEANLPISAGDRLYLYSDGLTEVVNDANEQFGSERLSEVIEQTRSQSIEKSIEGILESVRNFAGGKPFDDDVSVLAVEIADQQDGEHLA